MAPLDRVAGALAALPARLPDAPVDPAEHVEGLIQALEQQIGATETAARLVRTSRDA